ncbi:NADH-quinone oxidoreductase subunit M [Roseimicrobium sp. ORNL1]|uniref:complex I subunit 4 family protein n=1 Tax=Roseimicrobium sp. ORNL1 TaxID=2711231 RepID=UPI0013E1EEB9|nr:NADH-quinone oxidoreductase subunit M [Roseimicrobium sp. ORNL1]QIF04785.1 NADH-quinone oxidoreductase subunit M [Roseimicrobium sp. ORNL1]
MSPLEIIILLPLLAAIAIWLGAPARATALGASVVNLLLVLGLFIGYRGDASIEGKMAYINSHVVLSAPKIAFAVGADGISLTLALLTVLVTLAAVWATTSKEKLHYGASLLIASGALGAFLCTDIFFLYAFHELALIPTFLMIALYGHGEKRQAAWRITIYLGVGSLILLAGLLGVVWYCRPPSGELTFDLLTLLQHPLKGDAPYASFAPINFFVLLVGFGTLVSLFPFHSWAAPAYAASPTPVAMLHSGVLKKFGLYGLIRIALPLLPEAAKTPWVQHALLYMLLGNILVIGFVTIHQSRLDTMLANSSVMHMGYIFLGLAAGNAIGTNGAVLLMFGHGISVALLFMICGRLRNQLGTLEFAKLGGLAKNAPFLSLLFGIAAFASIGLPGLANFSGEVMIFFSTFESFKVAEGFTFLQVATIFSLWGVVMSAVYMLRAYRKLFFGQAASGLYVSDPGFGLRVPMILLAAALFIVGVYPGSLLQVIDASLKTLATLAAN